MALSPNWTLVRVFGTFLNLDNTPAVGSILFKSSQQIVVDGQTVVPGQYLVDLNANGFFEVQLPATDDPDLSNTTWAYEVRELFRGGRVYNIVVPFDGGDLDLATVPHATPTTPTAYTPYLKQTDVGTVVPSKTSTDAGFAAANAALAASNTAHNGAIATVNTAVNAVTADHNTLETRFINRNVDEAMPGFAVRNTNSDSNYDLQTRHSSLPHGMMFLAGNFVLNGNTSQRYFQRVFADGSPDPTFDSRPSNPVFMGMGGIRAKDTLTISLETAANSYNGTAISNTAVSGNVRRVIRIFAANGALDTSFQPFSYGNTSVATFGTILLHTEDDQFTYLSKGRFDGVDTTFDNTLTKLSTTGSIAAEKLFSNNNGPSCVTDVGNNKIVVTGTITNNDGYTSAMRLNVSDLTTDNTFPHFAFNQGTASFPPIPKFWKALDGSGYWMTSYNRWEDVNGKTGCVIKVDNDFAIVNAVSFPALDTTNGPDDYVDQLVETEDFVVISGFFSGLGGVPAPGIARFFKDGTRDTTFNPQIKVYEDNTAAVEILPYTAIYGVEENGSIVVNAFANAKIDNTFLPNGIFRVDRKGKFVSNQVKLYTTSEAALKANVSSPVFTDVPAAPTAANTTANTQLATTAFVRNQRGIANGSVPTNANTKIDSTYFASRSANVAVSAGVVTWDLNSALDFQVILTANVTSSSFTNTPPTGYAIEGLITLRQDGVGGRTFAFPSGTKWANAVVATSTTTANAADQYKYRVDNNTGTPFITFIQVAKDVK